MQHGCQELQECPIDKFLTTASDRFYENIELSKIIALIKLCNTFYKCVPTQGVSKNCIHNLFINNYWHVPQ